uniref:Deoxyribonuclease TATDN3 n=1 Tax=Ditylenchus dipsaci TaxID=166011 RepID=A0A915DVS7_9BILA
MIDCHSHLADPAFTEDIDEVLERAKQANVIGVVVVAEFLGDFDKIIGLHNKYPSYIHPCIGIHPIQRDRESVNGQSHFQGVEERIRKELNWLVGIGEVGLDFSPRFLKNGDDDKRNQREVFKKQIELANELDLALNVHSRSAGRPTIDFLKENGAKKVLLHAFNGNIKSARGGVESGYFFSIPPSFTLSEETKAFVRSIPLEQLCLETDSPVLGPSREERNEPKNVLLSAQYIAKIKDVSVEEDIVIPPGYRFYEAVSGIQPDEFLLFDSGTGKEIGGRILGFGRKSFILILEL